MLALSPARLRQALLWNCCATARSLIEPSQINPDNSSWSLPGFLLETYELTLRSTQPGGTQATSEQSVPVSQPSLKDQPNLALMTLDRASVGLSPPLAPSAICHPSGAHKR